MSTIFKSNLSRVLISKVAHLFSLAISRRSTYIYRKSCNNPRNQQHEIQKCNMMANVAQ